MSDQGKNHSAAPDQEREFNHTKNTTAENAPQDAKNSTRNENAPQTETNTEVATPNPQTDTAEVPSFKSHLIAVVITFVVVALTVLFGILLITGKGIFHEPGKIVFWTESTENTESTKPTNTPDDTTSPLTEVAQNFINENLQDLKLKSDLTFSSRTVTHKLEDTTNAVLYQILVPTVDFYDATISVTAEGAKTKNLVSIWDLTSTEKLLAIDDNYYLDTLDSGAFFEYYILEGNAEDIAEAKTILESKIAPFPAQDEILTFAQTGVTALSRGMTRKLSQVGDAEFFSANIGEYLSSFDLTHTSNESSFSTSANDRNICSRPEMIDVITSSGIDIIELTGNHNQDCGDQAAIETINLYQNLGIKTVGGGKTEDEAAIPLEISEKGTNITMLAYNYSTGGYTTDNTPGANLYTKEKAKADIATAKERGDFVIVDIQFYECNSYVSTSEDTTCDYANSSAGDQISFFRNLIDLGADVVVGTSAHQPQTFELYKDGAIYYGLGNLFFDQSWWPGTTRSIILVHYFIDGKLVQTRLVPTVYDQNYQTKLMDTKDAETFLARLIKARPAQD